MQQKISLFFVAILFFSADLFAQAVKVACIGNSVTYGYGLKNPSQESYPSQLQQLLGNGYEVKNFGHSGATLLKKGHNPYDKTKAFSAAIAYKPDIAVVHLGLNDTDPRNWPNYNGEFEADYNWLLDTLRKINPAVKLYICRLTPIFNEHPRFKSGTRDWYWQIQRIIPEIAKASQTSLIDLHEPLYHRPDLFADNLHPDKDGATIIARTVYQSISKDYGGFRLATVFASNMVLQRQQPIPVYGTANPGDVIIVSFQHRQLKTTASTDGQWKIVFPASQHGGPYDMKITCGKTSIVLNNILIGDIWLCSGQSNMDFKLKHAQTGMTELKAMPVNPLVRLYKLNALSQTDHTAWDSATLAATNQLKFFSGSWKLCDSAAAADFSAIGYYFGKKIANVTQVPIGLVQVAVGGSPIESWIDRYTMEQDPQLVDVLSNWRRSDFIMDFCRERAGVNLKNATNSKQRHPYEPCYNYEAGIDSLTKFPIKGVIWYQGESNAHNVELYTYLFPAMVHSWRKQWGYDFPFYYVQLSGIDRPSWPSFREAQRRLQKQVPNSGMAVSSDLGDSLNVHPVKKKEVAVRLAALALRYTYHRPVAADGPSPLQVTRQDKNIMISFAFARKLTTGDSNPLAGFELITSKGIHIPAIAFIRNNQVLIPMPQGVPVKAVAYAWEPFTRANLVNEADLPASTFILPLPEKAIKTEQR